MVEFWLSEHKIGSVFKKGGIVKVINVVDLGQVGDKKVGQVIGSLKWHLIKGETR